MNSFNLTTFLHWTPRRIEEATDTILSDQKKKGTIKKDVVIRRRQRREGR